MKTINLDGTMVNVYEDGSVEWLANWGNGKRLIKTSGSVNGGGYLKVRINNKQYMVHRIIAMAFHENPNNYPEIDHIDRNKKNNTPENLRWCTRKENADNRDYVDKSLEKYGVRSCDDRKAYKKEYGKHCLTMARPDRSKTGTGALSQEIYDMLKPLTKKERYNLYLSLREEFKDGLKANLPNNLPNYASASRIRQEFINLGKRYNNGIFSAALVKAKFIKPIGNSKRFTPGQKWTESMGVVEEMTYSRGGSNGSKYIMAYNTKHPVIRNILNNIWFNSLDLKKK